MQLSVLLRAVDAPSASARYRGARVGHGAHLVITVHMSCHVHGDQQACTVAGLLVRN